MRQDILFQHRIQRHLREHTALRLLDVGDQLFLG